MNSAFSEACTFMGDLLFAIKIKIAYSVCITENAGKIQKEKKFSLAENANHDVAGSILALPQFQKWIRSGMGSIKPCEDNWGVT